MDFLAEMEQCVVKEPFNPNEFVERLAWMTMGVSHSSSGSDDSFSATGLLNNFEETIKHLQVLQVRVQGKCDKLEAACREEESKHWMKMAKLEEKNKATAAVEAFHELDARINNVATKVVYLGDQLENVNTPRSRAVEAQKLLTHFNGFIKPGGPFSPVFSDKEQLFEAADIIQKLQLVAQELPSSKFSGAQKQIAQKYDEIERSLIEEFAKAQVKGDRAQMKHIASILSHFKGYSQCIDAFIEQSQAFYCCDQGAFSSGDMFLDVVPLCERNAREMKGVFHNPEQVMGKFILNIFYGKLQGTISTSLADRSRPDTYLKRLHELYSRTTKLSIDLARYDTGNDHTFLSKLVKNIFQRYLESYISLEIRNIKERSASVLKKFYEYKNHQKKPINTGGIQELRRDLQAVIVAKTGAVWETHGGETFLSEQIAVSLLDETKQALIRCHSLSRSSECAANAVQILDVLFQFLIDEFVDYALEIGLQAIPPGESKVQPELYFFGVVREVNAIVHLMDKLFHDSVIPLVVSTPKHGECLQRKKTISEQLENKLEIGIDRSLSAIVGYVKVTLQSEQKKGDFKPEGDEAVIASQACIKVCRFVSVQTERIRTSLDGKNQEAVLNELGVRFHRVIYEHFHQFQYNSMGALCAICDVNEYKKCVQEFKIPMVTTLFDTLHALCNLLLVLPENLKQVCTGDQLAALDRSILSNFIQLRADFKTARLGNYIKTLSEDKISGKLLGKIGY
uniref:Exocyst complex component 5 n=1 Tax=Daphnia galeata TaxID=27404 RepID=A0A8J2WI79_9CRUS|nr:unnamed protein product [Daphnia galeata]